MEIKDNKKLRKEKKQTKAKVEKELDDLVAKQKESLSLEEYFTKYIVLGKTKDNKMDMFYHGWPDDWDELTGFVDKASVRGKALLNAKAQQVQLMKQQAQKQQIAKQNIPKEEVLESDSAQQETEQ